MGREVALLSPLSLSLTATVIRLNGKGGDEECVCALGVYLQEEGAVCTWSVWADTSARRVSMRGGLDLSDTSSEGRNTKSSPPLSSQ